jgi:arylsulfatase A-like enzyme
MDILSSRIFPSLKALLGSWVCCNLAFWIGATPLMVTLRRNFSLDMRNLDVMLVIGFVSAICLLICWLVLALPFELGRSKGLGSMAPGKGARIGALTSLPLMLLVAGFAFGAAKAEWSIPGKDQQALVIEASLGTLPHLLSMLATGLSFGWLRQKWSPSGPAASDGGSTAATLLVVACLFAPSAQAAEPFPNRPNILFIVADDLATRLGCYGDAAAITPNLDRLAKEGVVFDRAYAQGVVCTPSRTSFMLGLNNRHANPNHFIKNPDTITMGRWFREHGYQTCAIGKLDHDDPKDSFVDPKAWDVRVKREDMPPKTKPAQLKTFDEDLGQKRARIGFYGTNESVDAIADATRAERLLKFFKEERDPKKPFLACIGFHAPHVPWEATRAAWEAHDPKKFLLEPTPADATPLPKGSLLHEPGMELSEARQREGIRAYYAAVTSLDAIIGDLLARLKADGHLENTLIVFTSDHGYHLGWRGQWCKHSVDEQVTRVPLIVKMPGAAAGRSQGIVELLDLFPSFSDFAGLPTAPGLDGKSFLPNVRDPKSPGKPAAFCRGMNGRTVRTLRYRLTERSDGTVELYDHAKDPLEYHSIAALPENAATVQRLRGLLLAELGPLPSSKK